MRRVCATLCPFQRVFRCALVGSIAALIAPSIAMKQSYGSWFCDKFWWFYEYFSLCVGSLSTVKIKLIWAQIGGLLIEFTTRIASQVRKSPAAEENALFDQTLFITVPALRTQRSRDNAEWRCDSVNTYKLCVLVSFWCTDDSGPLASSKTSSFIHGHLSL